MVYGGINPWDNRYYNEVHEFLFKINRWQKVECIHEENVDDMGLAYHTMVPVLENCRVYNRVNHKCDYFKNTQFTDQLGSKTAIKSLFPI